MEERLKLNIQIYEEACEWFVDCRAGDLDDAGREVFHRWLRKSPDHLGAYLEIAAIWDEALALDPAGKWDGQTLIARALLNRQNVIELAPLRSTEIPNDSATSTAPAAPGESADPPRIAHGALRQVPQRRTLATLAACLVVALAGGVAYLATHRSRTYVAAIGEQRSVTLADGSMIELDSRSKVVVRYSDQERRVNLVRGQALFRVAKNANRPFIVRAGDTLVRAVGTEFDVEQKRAGTVVTVVEGRVAVLTGNSGARNDSSGPATGAGSPPQLDPAFRTFAPGQVGNIMLAAGEQLTVTPKLTRIVEHPNVANVTAWTQHRLVFESTALTDVADEFNRYNDRQLIVTDPRLKTFRVSGVFSSTDPGSLIRFLRARPELRLVETKSEIRIEQSTP